MAQSMRLWGGSAAASKNVIRQHRSAPPLSTWLPCPSLISTGRSTPCLHCQASPLSSAATDQPSTGPPPVSPSNEKTPEENVNQLGWLWDRSAAATQRKLSDQKIRPKKCAKPWAQYLIYIHIYKHVYVIPSIVASVIPR